MKRKKLMIIAGETSGDLQAAYLIKSLKSTGRHFEIFGMGGQKMKEEGVEIIRDISGLAVVGFIEVLKHLGLFKKIFAELTALLDKRKPDAVILVDYPGFNMRFAKIAKEKNIPVIYYISPQIWAWGKDRVREIKNTVDKMIVIFGFEEEIYKEAGINTSFIGHPFLDIVKPDWKKEEAIKHCHLKHDSIKIGLFPGSRQKEIENHLPCMLKACEIIQRRFLNSEFALSKVKELPNELYNNIISKSAIKPHSLYNRPYDILNISDIVIVSSGSATLETAVMEKPMVIIYKTSLVTWALAKNIIRIPHIGLVNIVAGEKIVPELLQFNMTPENIAKESIKILEDKNLRGKIKENLSKVKNRLGEPGAADRAAHIINQFLDSR